MEKNNINLLKVKETLPRHSTYFKKYTKILDKLGRTKITNPSFNEELTNINKVTDDYNLKKKQKEEKKKIKEQKEKIKFQQNWEKKKDTRKKKLARLIYKRKDPLYKNIVTEMIDYDLRRDPKNIKITESEKYYFTTIKEVLQKYTIKRNEKLALNKEIKEECLNKEKVKKEEEKKKLKKQLKRQNIENFNI